MNTRGIGSSAWVGTVTISCRRGRSKVSPAVNMHAMILQSLSLGLNKNAHFNKGHWAERLNWAKPPIRLHRLNFTSHGPGGRVYPSNVLQRPFGEIWTRATGRLKWYWDAFPISSPKNWNKASGGHRRRVSSLYLDQFQISTTATKRIPDMGQPGSRRSANQNRWRYGWLNMTHTGVQAAACGNVHTDSKTKHQRLGTLI